MTFRPDGGQVRPGVVAGDRVLDVAGFLDMHPLQGADRVTQWLEQVPETSMLRLLATGRDGMRALARYVEQRGAELPGYSLEDVRLQAPVMRPGKIIGVGKNYADHAAEVGSEQLPAPKLFSKFPSVVVGPGSSVEARPIIKKMDFEAELAVVIGAFASKISAKDALDVVAGYTILNDVSAREFQRDVPQPQTSFAKSMDGFCPMGPWIVTADEITDPQDLQVSLYLNGQQMQNGHTGSMIFPVRTLIEYITQYVTLEPGDIIATGTPSGVGAARKPPVWLKPGDQIRIDISRIGTLEHGIC